MPTQKQGFAFTQKRIEDLPTPKTGRTCIHDTKVPGLVVRVTAAGSKVFYIYRKLAGRPLRIRIGSTAEVTVNQARTQAEELNGKIAKGINPQVEKRQARQEAIMKETTLHNLWEAYLELHAKPRKRTWKDDERQYNKYLKPWHNRKLSSIQTDDVAKWHGHLAKVHGPIQANRTKALLATMFNKGGKNVGWTGSNPCKDVLNFPEQSRERFLLPNEMKAFFSALAAEDTYWQAFFLLCLFTGSRRGNVAGMAWSELDMDNAVWHIPAEKCKNKRSTAIALCPPAVAILQKRKGDNSGSPWVFPAACGDGHLIDPRKAWDRILARMRQCPECGEVVGSKPRQCPKCRRKLPDPAPIDLHMHDLRRTQGSWQAAMGISLAIIGKTLGHADLKSTQVYSRLQLDPVKEAVGRTADAMLQAGQLTIADGMVELLASPPEDAGHGNG
jgi:integrase